MVKHCGVRRSSLLWSVSYNVNPIAAATVAVNNTENGAAMQQGNKYKQNQQTTSKTQPALEIGELLEVEKNVDFAGD